MAGDDQLWGDGGSGQGNPSDQDILYGGQGNDDLIGGQGTNKLYAWSQDPHNGLADSFGVYVDAQGLLHDDSQHKVAIPNISQVSKITGLSLDHVAHHDRFDFIAINRVHVPIATRLDPR